MQTTAALILFMVLAFLFGLVIYMYVQSSAMADEGRFKMTPQQRAKDKKKQ